MEKYLRENFEVQPKRASEEALKRWRNALGLVKNPRRRFRMVADLIKRQEAAGKRQKIQEKIRVALYVQKAALHFIDAAKRGEYKLPEEVKQAGFSIDADELASIAPSHNTKILNYHGGVDGIANKISVSLKKGVGSNETEQRQCTFGCNKFDEKPSRTFWMFVWDALQDLTLIILMVCAVVSICVGLPTEGWPKGMYDGVGILLSILLVVAVTALSDYKQSLQFKELDKEKKNIYIQKISIHDLVVGDIVHLSVGDQVPGDGIFISGHNLLIDESSLSGESEPINSGKNRPFLLSGTKVQDGSANMLITAVGMKTEWGRLMTTLNEEGDDETPLQVKLNGVATIIGKIGLVFAVLTFLVLIARFVVNKIAQNELSSWESSDALTLLDYFATAVTIVVVAVPEGLPLAVTLSLAFAMKKLMQDKALVRHLSACETMGSVNTICTDKTGTLTTNHMVVTKLWISNEVKDVEMNGNNKEKVKSFISKRVMSLLLHSIFQNTGSEVVKGKDNKHTILGTPTETAILEFGLFLGGDFALLREEAKILKLEPFNSTRKKMCALIEYPNTKKVLAFCKGASEIVLRVCDKVLSPEGEAIPLSDEHRNEVENVINSFACDALRTLCLAYKDADDLIDDKGNVPEDGYTLVSVVGIKDPIRPGVKEAVKSCQNAGIVVRMVTGDNINTAKAIARECGILSDGGIAIEGPEFRDKSPSDMKQIIPHIQHTLVTQLRHTFNEVVAVTGDGTNDAPALHEADIGLAMGIAGTEVAKENADVVIMDDNFTTIVNVARWGRSVYINIQKFVQFQLTVNIVALIINFVSACISGSAPLTAVQLLWVNMIMDTLGALALATEPPKDELMERSPVGRDSQFITRIMWRNVVGQSLYQLVVLFLFQFDGKRLLNLNGSDATSTLNTFIFNTFVFCQVFNEINSRDMEKINVLKGIFTNWIFLMIVSSTVVFQIIIVQLLGTFADTVPLSWNLWMLSVGIGSISLPIAVVLKCIPVECSTMHHDGYEPLPSGPESA
ncbi:hypothetical protein V2J09_012078 [Rumex salicifolius]